MATVKRRPQCLEGCTCVTNRAPSDRKRGKSTTCEDVTFSTSIVPGRVENNVQKRPDVQGRVLEVVSGFTERGSGRRVHAHVQVSQAAGNSAGELLRWRLCSPSVLAVGSRETVLL